MLLQIACLLYRSNQARLALDYALLLAIFARSVGERFHLHTLHKQDFQPVKIYFATPTERTHTRRNLFQILRITSNYTNIYIYLLAIALSIYTRNTRVAVCEFSPLQKLEYLAGLLFRYLRTFLRTCRLSPCRRCYNPFK